MTDAHWIHAIHTHTLAWISHFLYVDSWFIEITFWLTDRLWTGLKLTASRQIGRTARTALSPRQGRSAETRRGRRRRLGCMCGHSYWQWSSAQIPASGQQRLGHESVRMFHESRKFRNPLTCVSRDPGQGRGSGRGGGQDSHRVGAHAFTSDDTKWNLSPHTGDSCQAARDNKFGWLAWRHIVFFCWQLEESQQLHFDAKFCCDLR